MTSQSTLTIPDLVLSDLANFIFVHFVWELLKCTLVNAMCYQICSNESSKRFDNLEKIQGNAELSRISRSRTSRIADYRDGESNGTSQQWPEIRPDLMMSRASCLPSSGPDIGEFGRRIDRIVERALRRKLQTNFADSEITCVESCKPVSLSGVFPTSFQKENRAAWQNAMQTRRK